MILKIWKVQTFRFDRLYTHYMYNSYSGDQVFGDECYRVSCS